MRVIRVIRRRGRNCRWERRREEWTSEGKRMTERMIERRTERMPGRMPGRMQGRTMSTWLLKNQGEREDEKTYEHLSRLQRF